MNKLKLSNVIVNCLSAFCIILICSCKKDSTSSIPFQGPQNASFETTDFWYVTFTRSIIFYQASSSVSMLTGTGFLPSSGIRYANMTANVPGDYRASPVEATLYQDNIDLSHATTMSFDYSFTGTAGAGGGATTVEIFFTSNGTQTLWTKTIDNTNAAPGQKINETITLPTTTSTGRLTIKLNAKAGQVQSGQVYFITPTQSTFGLDNIRVQ